MPRKVDVREPEAGVEAAAAHALAFLTTLSPPCSLLHRAGPPL
jgi:hypothetical protein